MSTGFIVDEDTMMERFDAATEKLSRALDLDPSKFGKGVWLSCQRMLHVL